VVLPQALVVDVQLAPERLQEPLVQVAVAEPEKLGALFVVGVLCVCDRPLTGKVQEPLVRVALLHGFVVEVSCAQLDPL
jgi:hypothetical protein